MTRLSISKGALLSSALLVSQPAFADVTAADIWEDWNSYMTDSGFEMTFDESSQSGALGITDLVVSMTVPDTEGALEILVPTITFTDTGNGEVSIAIPDASVIAFEFEEEGEAVKGAVELRYVDLSLLASGDASNITYSYTASSLLAELTELEVNGETIGDASFDLAMEGITGQSRMVLSELREITQRYSVDTMRAAISFADVDTGDQVTINASGTDLFIDSSSDIPIGMDPYDTEALFEAGASMDLKATRGSAETLISGTSRDGPFSAQFNVGASEGEVAVDANGFFVSGTSSDLAFAVLGGGIPIPVTGEVGEMGVSFEIPLLESDEPQVFGLGLVLGELQMADMLWNMFDAGNVLPRDPATLVLDLEGQTTLFKSLVDPDLGDEEFPGELNSLVLSDLVLSLAGAELTGTGDFEFDNSDMDSFDGLPRPLGSAEFRLMGGNALLDKLIQMGFVSEQDAMGARMMMGMFARPGTSEDELTSRIEVNEEGHVLANGQRLK